MSSEKRVFGLDVIRATAVLIVVFGHFLDHGQSLSPWIYNLKRPGVIGVEIFYVLSGYLIGGILIKTVRAGRFVRVSDLTGFWFRRWMRTLPLYFLFFFLYLHFEYTGPQKLSERLQYLVFLQNFAWTMPNFFVLSWSLAVEEYFYLLFPLFLWLILKRTSPRWALLISIGVFMIVPFILRALTVPYTDWTSFDYHLRMMVVKRLDAPMFGVTAVFVKEYYPTLWRKLARWTALPAILLFVVCTYIYLSDNRDMWVPPWSRLQMIYFPVQSCLMALLLPAFTLWRQSASVVARMITYLSTISYSIYLVHPLVIHWVRVFFEKQPGRMEQMDTQFVWLVLINSSLILLCASLTYFFWERLFLRLRDSMT